MARIPRSAPQPVKPVFIFMFSVTSSHVMFIGHDNNTTMFVKYTANKNDNIIYEFPEVSSAMFNDILNSESVGKAILATKIKGVKI